MSVNKSIYWLDWKNANQSLKKIVIVNDLILKYIYSILYNEPNRDDAFLGKKN